MTIPKSKSQTDYTVKTNCPIGSMYAILQLAPKQAEGIIAPEPGQFVQIEVPDSKNTFLRRPISVCDYDKTNNILTLLIRKAGEGTAKLIDTKPGATLNIITPLGRGFTTTFDTKKRILLIGGGVGIAPLLYNAKRLIELGHSVEILQGARSASDLLLVDQLQQIASVHITTQDGSAGVNGVVTDHPVMSEQIRQYDFITCCGPLPMMKAVANRAKAAGVDCEVSLENRMACGIGACLCCVEKDKEGHNVRVCMEGPVFNIKELSW